MIEEQIIFKIILSVRVRIQIVLSVFIARENMEGVSVDLCISTQAQVCTAEDSSVLVHILVLSSLEELAFHDSRILLRWFEYRNGVV